MMADQSHSFENGLLSSQQE